MQTQATDHRRAIQIHPNKTLSSGSLGSKSMSMSPRFGSPALRRAEMGGRPQALQWPLHRDPGGVCLGFSAAWEHAALGGTLYAARSPGIKMHGAL